MAFRYSFIKKIILIIEDLTWNLRCRKGLWLHGNYGLAKVIEKMPFYFIPKYLRKYGANIGKDCRIERGINIHRPFGINKPFDKLTLGDNVYLGHQVLLDLTYPITFKNASSCGSYGQLWTHASIYQGNTVETKNYAEVYGEIIIDEGTFIFSNSVVRQGIHIGQFSNIGACSLVNKDIHSFSSASGVPVKVVRRTSRKT